MMENREQREWREFLANQRAMGRREVERLADAARARLGLPSGQFERDMKAFRIRQTILDHYRYAALINRPPAALIVSSIA